MFLSAWWFPGVGRGTGESPALLSGPALGGEEGRLAFGGGNSRVVTLNSAGAGVGSWEGCLGGLLRGRE